MLTTLTLCLLAIAIWRRRHSTKRRRDEIDRFMEWDI
jgi:hypothetical protein